MLAACTSNLNRNGFLFIAALICPVINCRCRSYIIFYQCFCRIRIIPFPALWQLHTADRLIEFCHVHFTARHKRCSLCLINRYCHTACHCLIGSSILRCKEILEGLISKIGKLRRRRLPLEGSGYRCSCSSASASASHAIAINRRTCRRLIVQVIAMRIRICCGGLCTDIRHCFLYCQRYRFFYCLIIFRIRRREDNRIRIGSRLWYKACLLKAPDAIKHCAICASYLARLLRMALTPVSRNTRRAVVIRFGNRHAHNLRHCFFDADRYHSLALRIRIIRRCKGPCRIVIPCIRFFIRFIKGKLSGYCLSAHLIRKGCTVKLQAGKRLSVG